MDKDNKVDFVISETTLHVQKVLLMMLKDFDEICKKHHIRYYMNGGNVLGAIRHRGFIPWDDDVDIMLYNEDLPKLFEVLKSNEANCKYCLEERRKDWPSYYSKLHLRGTYVKEKEAMKSEDSDMRGIWIDIFPITYSPDNKLGQAIQYFCSKALISYSLLCRGYSHASFSKKVFMFSSSFLHIKCLRNLFERITLNHKKTGCSSLLFDVLRFKQAFFDSSIYGEPKYVEYEDTFLPVPEKAETYLSKVFGDYMKLPPIEKRISATHAVSVDFGKY